MFGYFRPYQANLTQAELQLFNGYYCRVCYCLRLLGGQAARFFTTFDVAVYSMLINLQKRDENPPYLRCQRLGKKNMNLFADDEIGLKLARLTFISFGEKFRDDMLDGNAKKTKLVASFFSRPIKEAVEKEPLLAQIAKEGTDEINRLQDGGFPLFEVLASYGDMTVKSFSQFLPLSAQTEEAVKALSEWIFFIDMICDYGEDYESGSYNGLKTDGCPKFTDYFNLHYREFLEIEKAVTDKLLNALEGVRDNSRLWNTLYKIILQAVDNVIPAVIEGKDVQYHYFKELRKSHKQLRQLQKDKKRLGEFHP